ncbi:ABC transporter ATP-binding protein [Jiangella alba]|uniref:Branched-chain amino acid transport system ATP-binding protein n=1 Tax=Jiangella alba TaxID=561176 RepID=A0A1H5K0M7_9ACTN|nr:ABC transporter ATP-binding protein [Jiangella alba]SEE58322.1 branched-chain amino acid transport system ATP-binding protein [Jiangella alba]
MTAVLDVTGLTAGYGPHQVLHGLDLHVDAAEIVVVLGANGAGKTTTLRALSGMIPSKGTVRLRGGEVGGRTSDARARLGLGHVVEGRGTFNHLSVEDNLALGAHLCRGDTGRTQIERWFEIFPQLAPRRKQHAGSLSGGEQQMLAVARAMISQPAMLLLDEPSMGLAPMVTAELFDQIARVREDSGTAMLIVEQNANIALPVADRAYVLESGRFVSQGSASALLDDDSVRRAYLGR